MSRIGKKPITIPAGVTVTISGHDLKAKGPKGELTYSVHPRLQIEQKDNELILNIADKTNLTDRALWGTMRQTVANTITGVSTGYRQQLEIKGVGYKAEVKGQMLILAVGYSHPVEFKLPAGITGSVEKNIITLEGINKEVLGETAANIRKIRKPEPYKGKGIRYIDEVVLRKAGKQVKSSS
ncbi:MAG TPA: 50S ribosomal protein L6 [Candidatus Paceibacterota bacterium]|nr:50S ribosomal protein L6 [Candidatus Paceibacterota bacterium]